MCNFPSSRVFTRHIRDSIRDYSNPCGMCGLNLDTWQSLNIIGNTLLSSFASATSSFLSSSSEKFAVSSYLDRPNRRMLWLEL
ncbi:hypothetical protein EMCRGX_G013750 [Ephydatia muelleri]